MFEASPGGAEVDSRVEDLLLAAKLVAPLAQQAGSSRAPIIDRVRASGSSIVSVVAPAGYGKSTMLAEWAARESRAVAWLSLDASDDDPAMLLRSLAAACAAVSAPAAAVVAEMRSAGSTLGRAAPLLAAALATTPDRFVLFVDDVHLAGSPGCRDVLDVVTARIPHGSQVVLAGRHQQPFLARHRATSAIAEIGIADLRVDAAGATTIFEAAGVSVSPDEARRAQERCEGWPAGLHLCALIARENAGQIDAPGDDRHIADYLYHECLERLPAATRRFLRRTAILDQLSAPLCDAVLGTADSQQRLRDLETRNLFLLPMDRTRRWYRYHALFREFLLAELHRVEGDRVADLHRRAAEWYEAHDTLPPAIEHTLAATDRVGTVRLVTAAAMPVFHNGQVDVVSRWFARLGEEAVTSHPPLLMLACWKALLMGETVEAERWTHLLALVPDLGLASDAERTFEANRAMIRAAMCVDGPQCALDDAALAAATEPPWGVWRDTATYIHGAALLLTGDLAAAQATFTSAITASVGDPSAISLCEAELAALAIDRGDWTDAARHSRRGVHLIDANHMACYSTSALAYAVSARVAIHAGDHAAAGRFLVQGMRARVPCTHVLPWLAVRVRLQLAKAHAAAGDHAAASVLAGEMAAILRIRPHLGALADEAAVYHRDASQLRTTAGQAPLSPAELRLLPYLQTRLTLAGIAERLSISRNTVSTHTTAIYRKLGVNSRLAAVERATEIGLLGR